MIVALLELTRSRLEEHGLYVFFMIFDRLSFRAIAAVILGFLGVVLVGRRVIDWLVRQKVGDAPEFHRADLNEIMARKADTPTMGGIMISGVVLAVTAMLGDLSNRYVLLGLVVLIWMSILGGMDDWLKLTSARRGVRARQGLHAWEKLLFQIGIGVLAGVFVYHFGRQNQESTHIVPLLPFVRAFDPRTEMPVALWTMSGWMFVLVAMLVIAGTSNAVNLTDGMDGLAGGIATICAFGLMILCGISGEAEFAKMVLLPYIPYSGELTVLAGAMAGACLGFLWYNCAPAQVFMGDTGSLAIGGLLGFLAVVIRQEFMLLVIGGVFFFEMLSVILQVGYFKATGGRRIFRCAPAHHHFHLKGWAESQVVTRFWLVTAVLTAVALATIKLR